MKISRMSSPMADRLREELKIFMSDFASTHEIEGITVELGNCSYDEAVEYHSKKQKYPYIYTDSRRPNVSFKGTTEWAKNYFGKVKA